MDKIIMNSAFSVLMSVYKKENPEYLQKSLKSIWDDQLLKPNDIVLIQDGELTTPLEDVIYYWKQKLGDILNIVVLPENMGLALALNEGLKHCNYEYIARMDTDDICTPNRFISQIEFLNKNKNIDIVGTYITEIDENDEIVKSIVKLPLTHDDLLHLFRWRNPMIHPSVMFRNTFFKKAGIYTNELLLAEDYHLWYKGFLSGCEFANIPEICLLFRRSSDFYKRRGGKKKLFGLLKFRLTKCNRDLKFGFTADIYAFFYFIIQSSPTFIRKLAYKKLR